jgi:hypothetical protein
MKRALLSFLIFSGTTGGFAATAVETPRLKPGLWEMHVQSSAGGANSTLPPAVCVGAMSDQQRQLEQDNIKKRCSKYESREVGGNSVIDAVCSTARGNTVTKHLVTSLSGDRFREENTAPQGSMTSDGKWLGSCKPGQAPEIFK